MLRIGLAQINTTVGDLSGNYQKIVGAMERAQKREVDIIAFPELAICGYPPEDLLFKEDFVRDNLKILRSLAKDVKKITAVVGFVDMDAKKHLYNAAAVIANGRIKGVYYKRALPNYGVFDEKRYFTEGRISPLFFYGKNIFAVNICEDIWVDNGVYREQTQKGAQLLINISSSPYHVGKLELREKLLMNRAKQTKAFICYVNLIGGQDELVFDGGSLIIDPKGKTLALGKQFEEDFIITDLEIPARPKKRKSTRYIVLSQTNHKEIIPGQPHLASQLSQIEGIYKALILGTRDYVQKNGFKKVVVGLSGGIDSSLVAVIAKEALGKENVIGVSMPSRFSSEGTKSDAQKVAENLGIRFMVVPIEEIFNAYLETLRGEFAGQPFNIAEENLQARIRGNILMAFSNKFGWLVLTTGNKSEIAVGYCTLYGDMSGGFAVIKDVPKTKVYELARLINSQQGNIIPESVYERAPTAELRENQKDRDSLPPYNLLDQLLRAYVEEHQSFARMSKQFNEKHIIKEVIKMVDRSEYKRRQAPPGVKITPRAFGKDWRLPITNQYKEF